VTVSTISFSNNNTFDSTTDSTHNITVRQPSASAAGAVDEDNEGDDRLDSVDTNVYESLRFDRDSSPQVPPAGQTTEPEFPFTGQTTEPEVPSAGKTIEPEVPSTGQTIEPDSQI